MFDLSGNESCRLKSRSQDILVCQGETPTDIFSIFGADLKKIFFFLLGNPIHIQNFYSSQKLMQEILLFSLMQ